MSKKAKDILLAISASTLSAALQDIGSQKPRIKIERDEKGDMVRRPMLDDNNDPIMQAGGFTSMANVELAFDDIKDLKLPTIRAKALYTYADIMRATDIDIADAFNKSIDLAIAAADIPAWVGTSLDDGGGVRLDGALHTALISLIGRHGITQSLIDTVFASDDVIEKRFPGLKLGHVQNAIHARHRSLY